MGPFCTPSPGPCWTLIDSSTVWRRLSRLGALRIRRVPDLGRYRRMVAAREGAPHGAGHELASRFGLTLGSWEVMLHRARAALSR